MTQITQMSGIPEPNLRNLWCPLRFPFIRFRVFVAIDFGVGASMAGAQGSS